MHTITVGITMSIIIIGVVIVVVYLYIIFTLFFLIYFFKLTSVLRNLKHAREMEFDKIK